jgi:hypothetical protein
MELSRVKKNALERWPLASDAAAISVNAAIQKYAVKFD